MSEIITQKKNFKALIHIIRGQQVMLDSDLANLYGTEVKNLNKQVKRNLEKFPNDFMFQLTMDEAKSLRFQNGTLNKRGTHTKYAPYVFTEQGIYMVATILKNEIATQQSIYIMRSFKEMKHCFMENQFLFPNVDLFALSNTVTQNKEDIQKLKRNMVSKSDINTLMDHFIDDSKGKEKMIMNGQVFDAAQVYVNIYKQAKQSIYLIDDYINMDTLALLKNKQKDIDVIIFTRNKSEDKLVKKEVDLFNTQYPTLSLRYTTYVHDRFIIIDYGTENELFYLCGASSKDAGKKVCTITQLYSKHNVHHLIDMVLQSKAYEF